MPEGLDLVVVTNSPGELSSWVRVTVGKLKELHSTARIIVMLVPCPFASGRETEVAQSFAEVDVVVPPGEFFRFLLGGKLRRYEPAKKGIVVFLGGDFWHALWAAWRLRYRKVAYASRPSSWLRRFDAVCVTSDETRDAVISSGVPEHGVHTVGDLMVEGVQPSLPLDEARVKWGIAAEGPTIGFLPGSRLYHVRVSLPVFLAVADELREKVPQAQFLLGLSPFISLDELRECLKGDDPVIRGAQGRLEEAQGEHRIVTEKGTVIPVLHRRQYDVMNLSDLVITIPGTNTAELASLAKPMIVASTLRAKVPRGGLGGILGALPLGAQVHHWLLKSILKKMRFTALPNLMAGREVVPEVLVERSASEITDVAAALIADEARRKAMADELSRLMGKPGAALRFSQVILNFNGRRCAPVSSENSAPQENNRERMGV